MKLNPIPTLQAPQIVAPVHIIKKDVQNKLEPKIIPKQSPTNVVKNVKKTKKKKAKTPDYLLAAKAHLERERKGETSKVIKKTKVLRRKKRKTT